MNKRNLGNDYENLAEVFLVSNGVKILHRNYNTRYGELDIIGMDREYLVFFEVKFRYDNKFGDPLSAVTKRKQKNIISAAKYYLYKEHYPENTYIRFDCIGILGGEINWLKNAFSL